MRHGKLATVLVTLAAGVGLTAPSVSAAKPVDPKTGKYQATEKSVPGIKLTFKVDNKPSVKKLKVEGTICTSGDEQSTITVKRLNIKANGTFHFDGEAHSDLEAGDTTSVTVDGKFVKAAKAKVDFDVWACPLAGQYEFTAKRK
jgi:hypothetical protein